MNGLVGWLSLVVGGCEEKVESGLVTGGSPTTGVMGVEVDSRVEEALESVEVVVEGLVVRSSDLESESVVSESEMSDLGCLVDGSTTSLGKDEEEPTIPTEGVAVLGV